MLGGTITSLGNDSFHAEAILGKDGRLAIYLLGADETRLQPVDPQSLTAYLKQHKAGYSTAVLLQPAPLADDPPGTTTRFSAAIPAPLQVGPLYVAVPGLVVDGERYMVRFAINTENPLNAPHLPATSQPTEMPKPVSQKQAQQRYLTPGGLYTKHDIKANGMQTAAQKYLDFRPEHDPNPLPGDLICPITKTKANAECSWIIDGAAYNFCCPPCIDEFLELAKSEPDAIRRPAEYRQEAAASNEREN